jgi:hypothetical protein
VISALARKELRDQRPFLVLGLFLAGIEVLDATLSGHLDMRPLSSTFHQLSDPSVVFQLLLAFAMGTGLLVREQDEGTLRFLDGLPVTRMSLFACKLTVAFGVLAVYPTSRVALLTLQHAASRSSLNPEINLGLLAMAWGVVALLTLVGLSLGMVLGYLRSLAWASLAALAIVVRLLGRVWPRALALDPLELQEARLTGVRWNLSTEALLVQMGLAAVLCTLAAAPYAGSRVRRTGRLALALRRPVYSALVVVVTLALGFTASLLYEEDQGSGSMDQADSEEPAVRFPQAPPGFLATRHYRFRYPALSAGKALALSAEADVAFEQVAALLPATAKPIDVDLSGSHEHTAGTAFWDRVRMRPEAERPLVVLAHETAHVLARRVVGEGGARVLAGMPVLDEGIAEWVAYRAPGGGEAERESNELLIAVLFARHEVLLEELVDFEALARRRDENLKYPLGAAVIEALVERHGEQAPRKILETLSRPDFPSDLQGLRLWQAAFQLSGYDLGAIVDVFFGKAEGWAREREGVIAALPRVRGVVRPGRTGIEVRVLADKDLPDGASFAVRFRPGEESGLRDHRVLRAEEDHVFLERRYVAHDTVCFQPGLVAGGVILYESWSCRPVKWAEDDRVLEEAAR